MRTRILLVLLACITTKLAAGPPFAIPRSEHLVVDGETGDWEDGLFTSVSLFTDEFGNMPDNQDLEPSLKMAWSKNGLILAVEVTDDHVSEPVSEGDIFGGDCLEIFVCDDVGGKNLMQYIISPFGEEVIWDHRGKRALQAYPGKPPCHLSRPMEMPYPLPRLTARHPSPFQDKEISWCRLKRC